MFFVSGAAIGTWAADLPSVGERVDASTATIGLCVFIMGIGSVASALAVGRLLSNRGSAPSLMRVGGFLVPVAAAAAIFAPSLPLLIVAVTALGLSIGALDTSMNTHGVAIEQSLGTAIMSSLHGGWSVGGMVGAGAVAAARLAGSGPRPEALVFFGVLLAGALLFGARLGDDWRHETRAEEPPVPSRAGHRLPNPRVLLIACGALIAFGVEGTATNWSSLYVVRDLGGATALGAASVAFFSSGMAAGRLLGDRANRLLGAPRLLRLGMAGSAISFFVLVLAGLPALAIPALFCAGVGLANGAPLLLSAAGSDPDTPAGAAVATVSTFGNTGLLVVAPSLGALGQFLSLGYSLGIAGALAAVLSLFARRTLA
jgi:fucose permease